MTREALGTAFATRSNAFHAVRLTLASAVVVWHSYLLPGSQGLPAPAAQLLERLPVDCFFALSGFLIVRSWQRHPHLRHYLRARALRILPGLWVCLTVTAFVLAPLVTYTTGARMPALPEQLTYVFGNAAVFVREPTIGATGGDVWGGAWNLSLWTLWWEVCAYAIVLALGIAGWLRWQVVAGLAAALWSALVALSLLQHSMDIIVSDRFWLLSVPRLGLMFALGGLLWLFRDRLVMSGRLAALAGLSVVAGAFLPVNYLCIAAPGLAYLCLWTGIVMGRWPWLRLRNDLSYGVYIYGAAIQTALLLIGLSTSWPMFTLVSLVAVLPTAWLSWTLVERPAMRLRAQARLPAGDGLILQHSAT